MCQTARFWYQIKMCKNNNLSFKKIWGIFYCGGQLRSDHGSTIGTHGLLEYSQCIVHRVYFFFFLFALFLHVWGVFLEELLLNDEFFWRKTFLRQFLKWPKTSLLRFLCLQNLALSCWVCWKQPLHPDFPVLFSVLLPPPIKEHVSKISLGVVCLCVPLKA